MNSQIKQFYSNSNILITGGSGLLGLLLIEKLLRTCTDIGHIYLIIRDKKGANGIERMKLLYQNPLFDRLREENPEFTKKIQVLDGDCSQLGLGLNPTSRTLLIEQINIVFHCAANLNMDAKMKPAVDVNVRGLRELLDLCHQMSYLKSMMFVSTTYSNSTQYDIEERLYDAPIQAETLITLTNEIGDTVLNSITPGLIDKRPNVYCYTKAVAENLFARKVGNYAAGLFRPSIVMPTFLEPIPGWTCNIYGPVGFMLAAGMGLLRVACCEANYKFDYVPADFCVNALICTAWDVHEKRKNGDESKEEEVTVYNYSAGPNRSMSWNQLNNLSAKHYCPFKNRLWHPTFSTTASNRWFNVLWFFMHIIPACCVDSYLYLTGEKPKLLKGYQKLSKFLTVLEYFGKREWNIINKNSYNLWNRLNNTDKNLFWFDMDTVDLEQFIASTCRGLKLYILKENLDNEEADKKRYKWLQMMYKTLKLVLMLLLALGLIKFLSNFI